MISWCFMKNGILKVLFASVLVAVLASCCKSVPDPLMKGHSVWTVSGVAFDNRDFSGLDFSFDSTRFVTVFNSAGVYWMDIPCEGDTVLNTSPLRPSMDMKRDLESVTVNRETGDIYYAQERKTFIKKTGELVYAGNTIYRLSAPDYSQETAVFSFDTSYVSANNIGLEGLTWVKGDRFLAGREGSRSKNPAPAIIDLSLSKGIASVMEAPKEIKQIAEVVFDRERRCLWILDSDFDRMLYRCTLKGGILNAYNIGYIRNAEGLCLDRDRKCIWIASDEKPSKLYRIDFENL